MNLWKLTAGRYCSLNTEKGRRNMEPSNECWGGVQIELKVCGVNNRTHPGKRRRHGTNSRHDISWNTGITGSANSVAEISDSAAHRHLIMNHIRICCLFQQIPVRFCCYHFIAVLHAISGNEIASEMRTPLTSRTFFGGGGYFGGGGRGMRPDILSEGSKYWQ
jgi:hypothetical protein